MDIFFVISGFVVAYSIGKYRDQGILDYLNNFYKRRLLRIYPVLVVFVITSTMASVLFVPLSQSSKFIEVTGATAIFAISNIFLWLKAGDYFSTDSNYNVFTHTWSLGVEEQYYLIFPFLSYFILVAEAGRYRRAAYGLLLALTVLSLALCAYMTIKSPVTAFYLLPTRFWELASGMLLYLACFKRQRVLRAIPDFAGKYMHVWSALALTLTMASITFADEKLFPFPWAVAPVFSTLLLIFVAVHGRDIWLNKALSNPIVCWVGKISFSLYLWHWAVIVLMKWTVGLDSLWLKAAAVSMMIGLSLVSYYLIENRARNASIFRAVAPARFFAASGAVLLATASFGIGAYLLKPAVTLSQTGNLAVWEPYTLFRSASCSPTRSIEVLGAGQVFTIEPCEPNSRTIYVMGDSHAGAYIRMLSRLAAEDGFRITLYTMGNCKLVDALNLKKTPRCDQFKSDALSLIATAASRGDVVFFPGLYTPRYRDTWALELVKDRSANLKNLAAPDDLKSLLATFARLQERDLSVVLEAPKPLVRTALFRCADWFTQHSSNCAIAPEASRLELLESTAGVRALQSSLKSSLGITVWDPFDILCPPNLEKCPAYISSSPLYYDVDHLSGFANDLLAPSFRALLKALPKDGA